jgi:hypothetical protein
MSGEPWQSLGLQRQPATGEGTSLSQTPWIDRHSHSTRSSSVAEAREQMRSVNWDCCSEASINCELNRLREVRRNLSECIDILPEDETGTTMSTALTFVQMAMDALASFQTEQVGGVSKFAVA